MQNLFSKRIAQILINLYMGKLEMEKHMTGFTAPLVVFSI
ncbi:hypothetical protein MGWOODY_Mmi2232 [hydrothermal vent metagenome]|uniref:Uncharacterized protein n=1 Tax=hydrothermal vent metagenome TaxID=652676 RepID=A0A170QCL6_9ZZZZ